MNKTTLIYTLALVGVIAVVGVSTTLGYGFLKNGSGFKGHGIKSEKSLEDKAEFFGLSVDELQSRLDEGKTFQDIIEEQGLDKDELLAEFKEQKKARMEAYLNELVEDGELTQEEADERLSQFQEKFDNKDGFIGKMHKKGGKRGYFRHFK